ncbi:MAG: redoxin domain-containing protein [Daejeonella sp.]
MKKTIQTIAMATLCLFLSSVVRGQTAPLKIGDTVPDITLNNVINYKSSTVKLSDFKGKLLIFDFWATWCAPCIAMIPKMDSLEKALEGKVAFLSVTYQKQAEVEAFIQKLEKQKSAVYGLAGVVQDKTLHQMFPHKTLPHYVWINGQGAVIAITEAEAVNAVNIRKALIQGTLTARVKIDSIRKLDRTKPLFIDNNGGDGGNLLYHSLLSSYTAGIGVGLMIKRDSTGMHILARNLSLSELYRLSYRDKGRRLSLNDAIIDVKDISHFTNKSHGQEYLDWLRDNNGYCYELILPPALVGQGFAIMQQDLARLFPAYRSSVEEGKTPSLVLVRNSDQSTFVSSGGKPVLEFDRFGCRLVNVPLSEFINRLKTLYMQRTFPNIIDETGYTGKVDMEINASLSDLGLLNKELNKYGLQLKTEERMVETLVIRENE